MLSDEAVTLPKTIGRSSPVQFCLLQFYYIVHGNGFSKRKEDIQYYCYYYYNVFYSCLVSCKNTNSK